MKVASSADVAVLELLAVELELGRAVSVAENTNGGTIAAVVERPIANPQSNGQTDHSRRTVDQAAI